MVIRVFRGQQCVSSKCKFAIFSFSRRYRQGFTSSGMWRRVFGLRLHPQGSKRPRSKAVTWYYRADSCVSSALQLHSGAHWIQHRLEQTIHIGSPTQIPGHYLESIQHRYLKLLPSNSLHVKYPAVDVTYVSCWQRCKTNKKNIETEVKHHLAKSMECEYDYCVMYVGRLAAVQRQPFRQECEAGSINDLHLQRQELRGLSQK